MKKQLWGLFCAAVLAATLALPVRAAEQTHRAYLCGYPDCPVLIAAKRGTIGRLGGSDGTRRRRRQHSCADKLHDLLLPLYRLFRLCVPEFGGVPGHVLS